MNEAVRVLVVDDEEIVRESLAAWLRRDGHYTLCAPDGRAALAALRAEAWDVVLLDLKMPGMDGLQVLEEARREGVGAAFLTMTAYATVDTAVSAMKLGARDYLVKPLDPAKLSAVVQRIASQRGAPIDGPLRLEEVEKRHVAGVLSWTGGNVTHAARVLGIDRMTLYNKIKRYGLRRSGPDRAAPVGRS